MIVHLPKFLIPTNFTPIYLYELIDPRDGVTKYIGKTCNVQRRYNAHVSNSQLQKTTKKNSWIKSLKAKELTPIMRVIAITTNNHINEAEISKIASLSGLLNMTGGGDGQCLMSEETRQKIKQSLKNIIRQPRSEATKLKISKSQIGVPKPAWTKNRYKIQSKPIVAVNLMTGSKIYFLNAARAGRRLKASKSHILKCCHKVPRYKTCKGYTFKFLEDKSHGN